MNILVTGGAGFIGSHLVDALINLGHRVAVIDNLSAGNQTNVNSEAAFYNKDIRDIELVKLMSKEEPEVIFHLAAQTSVEYSNQNPINDSSNNIMGTLNLLNAALKHSVRKVIFSSSAAVYGNPEVLPIPANHTIKPISAYGISKYCVEQYLYFYHLLHGLDYTVLRYSNVYGQRQDGAGEGGVIATFIERIKNNEQIFIHGDGNQTRDFIYIQDVVAANLRAIESGNNEIFNIGTKEQTSINELFTILSKMLDYNKKACYGPSRPGDITHSSLDNRKAQELLGFSARFTLKQGLEEILL